MSWSRRELMRDLAEARARLGALDWAGDPAPVRWELEGVRSLVDHAARTHAEPPYAGMEPEVAPAVGDVAILRATGQAATGRALRALDDPLDWPGALATLAEALETARALHHRLDPFAAMQEEADHLVSVPQQIRPHPGARALDTCPSCDSPLGSGDRTWTGSYCEVCRTRWVDPEARDEP